MDGSKPLVSQKYTIIDELVVGSEQRGADDVQAFQRYINGGNNILHEFADYRDFIYKQYNITDSVTNPSNSIISKDAVFNRFTVMVMHNKREDLQLQSVVNMLGKMEPKIQVVYVKIDGDAFNILDNILDMNLHENEKLKKRYNMVIINPTDEQLQSRYQSLTEDDRMHDNYVSMKHGQNNTDTSATTESDVFYSDFLKMLQKTHVYISGIGTAMMYATLLPDHATVINLGCNCKDIYADSKYLALHGPHACYLHEMDHAVSGHLHIKYYDAQKRVSEKMIDLNYVINMVQELRNEYQLRSGHDSATINQILMDSENSANLQYRFSTDIFENLSESGKNFVRWCRNNEIKCQRLVGSVNKECVDDRYIDGVRYGDFWDESHFCARFAGITEKDREQMRAEF